MTHNDKCLSIASLISRPSPHLLPCLGRKRSAIAASMGEMADYIVGGGSAALCENNCLGSPRRERVESWFKCLMIKALNY